THQSARPLSNSTPHPTRRSSDLQLERVQRGLDPDDWKPMQTIGPGVREIRVRDASGAFRVIYARRLPRPSTCCTPLQTPRVNHRSEEHTSELQSQSNIVCRLLLE